MFKISPIQDEDTKRKYAELCGTVSVDGYFAYSMIDQESGELMGFSQFDITGETGYISDLREPTGRNDFEAMFILGRSTMNFIDMCGTHKCTASKNAGDEKLMHAIGFCEWEDDHLFCDMTDMFSGHCHK